MRYSFKKDIQHYIMNVSFLVSFYRQINAHLALHRLAGDNIQRHPSLKRHPFHLPCPPYELFYGQPSRLWLLAFVAHFFLVLHVDVS